MYCERRVSMKSSYEKYLRELHAIARQLSNLIAAAQNDISITIDERQDITLEVAKVKSHMADCLAALYVTATDKDEVHDNN